MTISLYVLMSLAIAYSQGAKSDTSILPNEPETLSHTFGPTPSEIEEEKQEQEEKKKKKEIPLESRPDPKEKEKSK